MNPDFAWEMTWGLIGHPAILIWKSVYRSNIASDQKTRLTYEYIQINLENMTWALFPSPGGRIITFNNWEFAV